MTIKEAPFDGDGNMVSYPGAQWVTRNGRFVNLPKDSMRPVEPFTATMQVIGMETGRSAKRLVLMDVDTGKTYPLFVADIVAILKGVPITGVWSACKRGQNYGIKREPLEDQ